MIMKLVMVNPFGRSHAGQCTQQIMLSQTSTKTCAVSVLNRTSTMSLNNPAETGLTVPVIFFFFFFFFFVTERYQMLGKMHRYSIPIA